MLLAGCRQSENKSAQPSADSAKKAFDVEGHRGARGTYPENSIPGFVYALELGVTTLEMDVVVSSDGKLVVSHDPWMSSAICLHPDGTPVTKDEEASLNLYRMNYDEIRRYDCGSRGNKRFPSQNKMAAYKPLLSEVIDTIEKIIRQKNISPVNYNIETKCAPSGDNIFHPAPAEFTAMLLEEIRKLGVEKRVIVQSFDIRTLQEMNGLAPEIRLAFLEEAGGEFSSKISDLGFTPAVYSPDYHLLNESLIVRSHSQGMLVIPWTVNDTSEMKRLIDLGVDGIITDYPNDLLKLVD